jgi:hypothetical protein
MFSTVAWTGGGDQVNWTDRFNWSGHSLPAPSDDVVIGAGAAVRLNSAGMEIRSIDLSGSLTIDNDALLRLSTWFVKSTVNAGGTLTIDSSASFSGNFGVNLDMHGTMNWLGGFSTVGNLSVFPEGHLNITGPNSLVSDMNIFNEGSAHISGGDLMFIRHAGLLNSGTLTLSGQMHLIQDGTRPARFENSGTIIRDGAGVTTLDDGIIFDGGGELRVDQGTMQFDGAVQFGALKVADGAGVVFASSHQLVVAGNVSLAGSAQVDLGTNDLVVDDATGSAFWTIYSAVSDGRAGGAWNGRGIISSAARDNPDRNTTLGVMPSRDFLSIYGAGATFDGRSIDDTAVLVKYTYYGDTDFNGVVNFDDYVRTDSGFNNHLSGWLNGDFDGNSQVNFDDYVLIDLAFNTQASGALATRAPQGPHAKGLVTLDTNGPAHWNGLRG